MSRHKTLFRYLFIPFLCLNSFGSYYCYDIPASIQSIIKRDLNINSKTFMGFYTWYSLPNIVLCFVGSFVVDRFVGLPIGCIVCILLQIIGQVIFASGGYFHHIWTMNIGRAIFGIGGETLSSIQNAYSALWFKGTELNFVFGVQHSLARIGSIACMKSMIHIYRAAQKILTGNRQLGIALYLAAFVCVLSLITSIVTAIMTRMARKNGVIKTVEGVGETYPVSFKDVIHFGTPFWLITIICCMFYIAIVPFVGIGTSYFQLKYQLDIDYATTIDSLIYLISAAASPLIGFVIDKTGRNLTWMIAAIVFGIVATFLFIFSFINPLPLVIMLGISYTLFASAFWPIVVYIIRPTHVTTAYGLVASMQSLGLTVAAYAVGAIVDKFGYFAMEVFFLACLYSCFLASIALLFCVKKNRALNANAKDIANAKNVVFNY